MLRLFVFGISLWLAACSTFSPADPEKADLHLRVGTSLLESGSYPQALSELLKAEELDTSNPIIQNNLGLAYFARERFDLAEKHIRAALDLKSDYTEARNNLARLLIETGRFAEADALLKTALEDLTYTAPEKIYLNLGLSAFRQKHYAEAKERLLKALDFQRGSCMGQTLYGRSLFELKDFARAANSLDRAVGFCSNQADEPEYYSALAYYELNEPRKAEARLEEILKLYPNGHYYDRARSMLETMRK